MAKTRSASWQVRAQAELERRKRQAQNRHNPNASIPPSRWVFRGAAAQFQSLNAPEICIAGPSETGKTIAVLDRLHRIALAIPIQAAIVRKYHVDLHKSVLRTFEKKIIQRADGVKIYGGNKAEWYDYPSGARLYVAGLDRSSAVLSSEFDLVYVNQAEEIDVEDAETLTTRTTGRAGNLPWSALWMDCNPRGSRHWILERERTQRLTLLKSFHRDNPSLYDDAGNLTERGQRTMQTLEALTGVRRKRLFEGLWVTPEGTVYDTFDREIHVQRRAASEFTHWLLTVDEGYTHPAVTLLIGVDPDLRLHIAREFYARGVLPSKHAALTLQWAKQAHTKLIVVDAAAAGLIAEMGNAGVQAVPSKGHVRDGIGLVHELLAVQKDKRPRLTADPECVNTINEFESYLYRKGTEEPLKENDHAMDATRNAVYYLFGSETETEELVDSPVTVDPRW